MVALAPATLDPDPAADLQASWHATHNAVFGADYTGGMPTFQLNKAVDGSSWLSYHDGFNDQGAKFGVELAMWHSWDKECDSALSVAERHAIATTGMSAAAVVGVLHGHENVSFWGMYVSLMTTTGQPAYHIIPMGLASASLLGEIQESNALLASGALDPNKVPAGNSQLVCKFMADARYAACMDNARMAFINCLKGEAIAATAAAAACTAGILIPAIGWGWAAFCLGSVVAARVAAMAVGAATYDTAAFACGSAHRLDLLACGFQMPGPY